MLSKGRNVSHTVSRTADNKQVQSQMFVTFGSSLDSGKSKLCVLAAGALLVVGSFLFDLLLLDLLHCGATLC